MLLDIKNEFELLKDWTLNLLSYYLNYPFVKPDRINFDITARCPLRCKTCKIPQGKKGNEEELSLEELKKVVDNAARWKIKYISFAGGETLLRKDDVIELIKYCSKRKIFTALITSGYPLNKKICEELIKAGLNKLTISIDGAREKTHDFIRGKGIFKRAIKAVRILVKLRKKMKSKIELEFTTVVNSKNFRELVDIYYLMRKVGFDYINYQAFIPDNSFKNNNPKTFYKNDFWLNEKEAEELESIVKELIKIKEKTGRIRNSKRYLELLPSYFRLKEKFRPDRCMAGYRVLNIDPYGNTTICWFNPKLNVRDKNLEEIWKDYEYKKARVGIKRLCKIPCMMLCYEKLSLIYLYRAWMDARVGAKLYGKFIE
jgi:MoaA/NifB/PqqE/SkfB family radical SAM enzyme